jgi:hypothetical protein
MESHIESIAKQMTTSVPQTVPSRPRGTPSPPQINSAPIFC